MSSSIPLLLMASSISATAPKLHRQQIHCMSKGTFDTMCALFLLHTVVYQLIVMAAFIKENHMATLQRQLLSEWHI